MIGCMTETSCAVSAAAQLSQLVDWADLDGALLTSNDVFDGMKVIDGKVTLNDLPAVQYITSLATPAGEAAELPASLIPN